MIKVLLQKFENGVWVDQKKHNEFDSGKCQLVLVFGDKPKLLQSDLYLNIKSKFPIADIVFASSSGEIIASDVLDNSIVLSALQFDKTEIVVKKAFIADFNGNSKDVGSYLSKHLQCENLSGIIILSDGLNINGGELVEGLNEFNQKNVSIVGGLAGDNTNFISTLTGLNDSPTEGIVVAIGLCGKHIKIGHGSLGGWDEFGTERTITKSDKNVLYELDGKNALTLYKDYLGDYSKELPASAFLFPLSLKQKGMNDILVRTILNINEENKTMTFAGNLPVGAKVRFMKANFDKLINASFEAGKESMNNASIQEPDFALLISCVGRKIILQERTDEEVEAAIQALGNNCPVIGYYSYGEISPFNKTVTCELHNQTMTITTLKEI